MGQAWGCHRCRRCCRKKRPDDFTFSKAFLEELKMISVYSERELENVFEVFKKMDQSKTGQLSHEDFQRYRAEAYKPKRPALGQEAEKVVLPMEDRLWLAFDPNAKGFVTFRDFVEVSSALSLQGPRDAKIRHAYKMMDFDDDGRVGEADIREYLTRITKLSQTKENLVAYERANKQAIELDEDYVGVGPAVEEDPKKAAKKARLNRKMSEEAKRRHRLLQVSRTATRKDLDGTDVEAADDDGGGGATVSPSEASSESKHAPAARTLSVAALQKEEEESVEKLRVKLIQTVAHTVILEAASNGMYLTLQDFSKVVESDSEFFSHMNLHLQ